MNGKDPKKDIKKVDVNKAHEKDKNPTPNSNKANLEYDFKKIGLDKRTLKAVEKMGFEKMTKIQAMSIPAALKSEDIIGAAKTGSGKTLAFLIPAVELLQRINFKRSDGTGIVIISPTRELALQISGVLKELCDFYESTSFSVIIGGNNRSVEVKKLYKNVNILVCTPGRLLDHLKNTKDFLFKNLKMLIIDEADRILDAGFEKDVVDILRILPKKRQTIIFSATQTKKTQDLMKLSFQQKPVVFSTGEYDDFSTREGLVQGYVKVEADEKFRLLYSFLRKNKKKTIVFISTCNATKFYASLLNYVDVKVTMLHGRMRQSKRTTTFFEFAKDKTGILLCTDVAARGLDIPDVDWIIQYDPPDNPKTYIHRVGRTVRGISGKGKALMFLLPEEMAYLEELEKMKIPVKEYKFPQSKIANVQLQLEKLIDTNFYLAKSAKSAYKSYMASYATLNNKKIFDIHSLDVLKVVKSFGFDIPPKINLNIALGGKKTRKRFREAAIGKNKKKLSSFPTQFSR